MKIPRGGQLNPDAETTYSPWVDLSLYQYNIIDAAGRKRVRPMVKEAPALLIRKGFVRVDGREVHFRTGGSGPPVVVLHDSPRSSVLHAPLIEALSHRHTVFALDTPGYGESEPLPKGTTPLTILDFSKALDATLLALSLERAAVYACHTSSKILLDLAVREPRRITLAILDGLAIPSGSPDEPFIAAYMRPFEIDAEGAWLSREWTRVRDSLRWFPWFAPTKDRIPIPTPDPAALHAYGLDYFMAGPNYTDAYAAAMRHSPLDNLKKLATPVVFMARADDVLYSHLNALPQSLPPDCRIDRLPADTTIWRQAVADALAAADIPRFRAIAPANDGPGRRYLDLAHGQVLVHRYGAPEGRPILYLHEPPGGVAADRLLLKALSADRTVYALDLPGCGQSDPLPNPTSLAYAEAISQTVAMLGLKTIDLYAEGLATPLALALMSHRPGLVSAAVLDGVILADPIQRRDMAACWCPPLALEPSGAYLHCAWTLARDREAQFPWYGSDLASIRHREPQIDPERLYALTLDMLKQPDRYGDAVSAALDFDAAASLRRSEARILVCDDPGDPRQQWSGPAAQIGRRVSRTVRAQGVSGWADQCLNFFKDERV